MRSGAAIIGAMHAQPPRRDDLEYTSEQLAVVDHCRGALLVLAGPGTGKTRVIVERIARLIERADAAPRQILALTFARRAAGEMHVRLAYRLGPLAGPVTVGTFHSFAFNLIQNGYLRLGYPAPPRVIRQRDRFELMRRVLAACPKEDLGPLAWCATRPFGISFISDAVDRVNGSPGDALDHDLQVPIAVINTAYHRERRAAAWLDHASMVPEAVRLLESDNGMTARLHDRYRQIIVDEYQDTDRPQEHLLELLAPRGANIMVVGDDDQTIYGFRGTSPRNLLDFQNRRAADRIDLTRNWRCGAPIQAATNRLIAHNTGRLKKKISADRADATVQAFAYADLATHARGLARLIDDEVRVNGRRCGDVVVLWRSLRHPLVEMLMDELTLLGIPALVVRSERGGGGLRSAVAAVVTMRRDGRLDDEPLAELLESELSGLMPHDVQRLRSAALRAGKPLATYIESCANTGPGVREAAHMVGCLRGLFCSGAHHADEILFELWRTVPALTKAAHGMDDPDVERQVAARRLVSQFQTIFKDAEAYTRANPTSGLDGFIDRLAADLQEPPELRLEHLGDDVVRLMTVHAVKGLEWPVVFVPALEEGYFPASASRGTEAALAALMRARPSDDGIAEERRILYAAMTRASERLVLSVDAEGHQRPSTSSRFFSEAGLLPKEVEAPINLLDLRTVTDAEARLRFSLHSGTRLQRAQAAYVLSHLPGKYQPEWWSLIDPTSYDPPNLDEADLEVSATDLAEFRACPYRFKMDSLLCLRAPPDPVRGLGVVVHEALRRFHAPDADHPLEAEVLADLIEELWDPSQFHYLPIAVQNYKDVHGFIDNYVRHHGRRGRALAVEQPFEMRVGGFRIRGRVDAIFPSADGVDIVDFKLGRTRLTEWEAATDLQLGIYGLGFDLAPELHGFGTPHEALYVYLRFTGERADGTRVRGVGPPDRDAVRAKLGRYERYVRSWELPPKSAATALRTGDDEDDNRIIVQTKVCEYCDFHRICPDFMAVRGGT